MGIWEPLFQTLVDSLKKKRNPIKKAVSLISAAQKNAVFG